MPKISGIFEIFENLDLIPTEDIARWIKPPPESQVLENYLANKIFYPQQVSTTLVDLNMDLAILREALKRNPIFYKPTQKKVFIPESFTRIVPDLKKLIMVFVDAYNPKDLVIFILSTPLKDEILGILITVECGKEKGNLYFEVEGKNFRIKPGTLTILPCPNEHCHISFKSSDAKIFGRNELFFEVPGGKLGLVVDGRLR